LTSNLFWRNRQWCLPIERWLLWFSKNNVITGNPEVYNTKCRHLWMRTNENANFSTRWSW
jgi:hypothetical protein